MSRVTVRLFPSTNMVVPLPSSPLISQSKNTLYRTARFYSAETNLSGETFRCVTSALPAVETKMTDPALHTDAAGPV
jgi:hypothetical protein